MKKLKILSIFSGIGGIDYGLEQTGYFRTMAFCENDVPCQMVPKKHWPWVTIYSDIKNFSGYLYNGHIDLITICGGFPCQDISVAGNKKGLIDEHGKETKSGLWNEYKRVIKEVNPRWVLIENVPNLRNLGLATVLKDLWEIGYSCRWDIISARSVGANHCHRGRKIRVVGKNHRL